MSIDFSCNMETKSDPRQRGRCCLDGRDLRQLSVGACYSPSYRLSVDDRLELPGQVACASMFQLGKGGEEEEHTVHSNRI